MIHAPAAEPTAIDALLAAQVAHGAPIRFLLAYQRESLHSMRRHVFRGRVDYLAEVAEGDLVDYPPRVVFVERSPAAVGRLHSPQPVHAPLQGEGFARFGQL